MRGDGNFSGRRTVISCSRAVAMSSHRQADRWATCFQKWSTLFQVAERSVIRLAVRKDSLAVGARARWAGMSALGQKWSFERDPRNDRFAPEVDVRRRARDSDYS